VSDPDDETLARIGQITAANGGTLEGSGRARGPEQSIPPPRCRDSQYGESWPLGAPGAHAHGEPGAPAFLPRPGTTVGTKANA
jgi:hypothetical protein